MRLHVIIILLVFIIRPLWANDVQFTGEAPNVVKSGQRFRLTYTVNTKAENFEPPNIQNFNILAGPSRSTSQNVSVINGQMTRTYQLQFTFVLEANKAGEFTISPAKIQVDGKTYKSKPLKIEVIGQEKSQEKQQQNAESARESSTQSKTQNAQSDDLFVRILVNKSNVYREEPLVATIKLYSKLNISGLENIKFPNFEGFYKQEIETQPLRHLEKENVNGEIYGTGILKKYLLFPQKTGNITIGPFEVDCIVQKKVKSQSRSIFDNFFGSYKNVKMPLSSRPMQINVHTLPSDKPLDFTGGVGNYRMDASMNKQSVKTNEGVTLEINITGNGNLKVLEPPRVNFPPDLEVYDPKVSNNIKVTPSGASGTKTIEYLIIPRHAGEYNIPPVKMSYFDPAKDSYHTLQSQPLTLHVNKGEGDTSRQVSASYSKQDVNIIGSDIRYIQTEDFRYKEQGEFLFGSNRFLALYTGSLAIFLAVFVIRRKKVRENADMAALKNKKANKYAKRRLKIASKYLKEDDKDKFYEETLKALWGYMSDKLGIPVAELSRENIQDTLRKKQIPEHDTTQFLELLDNCEFARYAPSGEAEKRDELYNNAIAIISRLQQKLK
jgi:hypothetical protein